MSVYRVVTNDPIDGTEVIEPLTVDDVVETFPWTKSLDIGDDRFVSVKLVLDDPCVMTVERIS